LFVQVIRGKGTDRDAIRSAVDRWVDELGPGAPGWLGSTSGLTEENELFAMVRFTSQQAASTNSSRPEQGRWWAAMEKLLDGDATFQGTANVIVHSQGDLNSATFVQVMSGKSSDLQRLETLMADTLPIRQAARPDIIGSVAAGFDDGLFINVVYFTSEAEARAAEGQSPTAEVRTILAEMTALQMAPIDYLDIKDPWLKQPRNSS
jgi:hypothetical protein